MFFLVLSSLLVSIICFVLANLIFFKNRKSQSNIVFAIFCLVLSYWAFTDFMFHISESFETAYLWKNIGSFLYLAFPLLLHFVLLFTEKTKLLKNTIIYALIYIPGFVFSILFLTSDPFNREIIKVSRGYGFGAAISNYFWIIIVWAISLSLISLYLITSYYLKINDKTKKIQSKYIITALFFPIILGTLTDGILPAFNISYLELTVFSMMFLATFISYAIQKHELFLFTNETVASYIISTMNESLVLFNTNGQIIEANQSLLNLLEYNKDELVDKQVEILFYNKDEYRNNLLKPLIENSTLINYETVYKTKSGKKIDVSISTSDLKDSKKNVLGYICTATDISKRKQAENEKQKLQEQLLQVQKMEAIGTLSAGIAHDFNNLLTSILGYTNLIMKKDGINKDIHEELTEIKLASERAAELTKKLLLFSRKETFKTGPLNINKTIKSILKMIERIIGENINITTEFEQNIWMIEADTGNIEQIIMNLAVNAKDAMTDGGKLLIKTENTIIEKESSFFISELPSGKYVCLSVVDTGIGMEKKTMDHIFEPFFTTKGVGKGTGLGLSVVYGIIKQYKGYINVKSEPGNGTTFIIYFPAIDNVEIKDTTKQEKNEIFNKVKGNGERILFVEDETALLKLVTKILTMNGYKVFPCRNGKEAIETFKNENMNFQLVFSDMILPDMDGKTLINELVSLKPDLSILIASGYTSINSLNQIIEQNKYNFLHKPYNVDHLLNYINDILNDK